MKKFQIVIDVEGPDDARLETVSAAVQYLVDKAKRFPPGGGLNWREAFWLVDDGEQSYAPARLVS